MSGPTSSRYDQQQLDDLFLKIRQALGPDGYRSVMHPPPRRDAFLTAIKLAIKAMGRPDKVEEAQIIGAVEIADEVWPVEAEIIAHALHNPEAR